MRKLLAWVVFVPLQVAFIPMAVIGSLVVGYKQLVGSKRLGVSATGIEVIGGRWTMHAFGLREDEPTSRLASALPNMSKLGLGLALGPLWVGHKVSGTAFLYPRIPARGMEVMADLVVARTVYFDRIIERIAPEVEQFVVLGAGYDTRAYGDLRRDGLRFFELDQQATQRLKTESLAKAGIESGHVTFVAVDFEREDAFASLQEAGYDPSRKTLFLWEGVTPYLSEADVRKTLGNVRERSAPGSAIVADLYAARVVAYASNRANRKALEYTGEGFIFGLPLEADPDRVIADFIESEGLTVGETVVLGRDAKKGPILAVVEVRV